MSRNFVTLNHGRGSIKVIETKKWYHSIDWVWFPISILYTCTNFAPENCKYTLTLKSGLMVIEGHQNRHASIRHSLQSEILSVTSYNT